MYIYHLQQQHKLSHGDTEIFEIFEIFEILLCNLSSWQDGEESYVEQ